MANTATREPKSAGVYTTPTVKSYRCVVKTQQREDGVSIPLAPFWTHSFGGKAFAVSTYRREKQPDGEFAERMVRGHVEEFVVGGTSDELERCKAAIRRKVVRWTNREKGRGMVLSVRTNERRRDERGGWTNEYDEVPSQTYVPRPGDEPLANYVAIEEIVEGSDRGPAIPLE